MRIPSFFKSFYSFGLALMMLTLSVVESFGQPPIKVYASSYGWEESTPVRVPILGTIIADGNVSNPLAAINENITDITTLEIFGLLLDNPFARYQFKFPDNLPAGTSIYLGINEQTDGLLGLLLTGSGFFSAQRDALVINEDNGLSGVTNSVPPLVAGDTTGSTDLILVTPQESFNAITIELKAAGLLNLLPIATIDIYYAYYECPAVTVSQQEPACAGHPFTLAVDNPINTNYTWYPTNSTANPLGTGNTITLTETTATTKNYYLKHNQFSATCGLDTVTVNIGAIPDNPAVLLE